LLGGSFFPLSQAGGPAAIVSLASPHAWFLRGLGELAGGGGPATVLPANRTKYTNAMPELSALTDAEVAAVVTYVRRQFGGPAAPISASRVAAVRARPVVAGQ
jgi:mono/diheme cytochrome c family protein